MKVLVACEESQEVCKAFRSLGHEAYSCDIQEPSGGHPEWHILGDALKAINGGIITTMDGVKHDVGKWDLLIAHPPCTHLSVSGARWFAEGKKPLSLRYEAAAFFMRFVEGDVPKIADVFKAAKCGGAYRGNGKVIGEFTCNRVTNLFSNSRFWLDEDDVLHTCLSAAEMRKYANGANGLYGWHISNLKIYDTPRDLWEFAGLQRETEFGLAPRPITRPPQSWRYVEEQI